MIDRLGVPGRPIAIGQEDFEKYQDVPMMCLLARQPCRTDGRLEDGVTASVELGDSPPYRTYELGRQGLAR